MALSESVLSELLDAFRAGEGVDLIRDAVQVVLQELIEIEATDHIGAARYERTDSRVTERNGSRPRLLTTQAGDVGLRIPKLRKGSFFPSILEPRRRIDQALYAVVMEAYVQGVSTRSVDDLVDALGAPSGIKKSEVSRICAGLDAGRRTVRASGYMPSCVVGSVFDAVIRSRHSGAHPRHRWRRGPVDRAVRLTSSSAAGPPSRDGSPWWVRRQPGPHQIQW